MLAGQRKDGLLDQVENFHSLGEPSFNPQGTKALTAIIAPDNVHSKKLIMASWRAVHRCPTAAMGIDPPAP